MSFQHLVNWWAVLWTVLPLVGAAYLLIRRMRIVKKKQHALVRSLQEKCDEILPKFLLDSAASSAIDVTQVRDALLGRIGTLEEEGVPVGAERRLVELVTLALAKAVQQSRSDPAQAVEAIRRQRVRLASIETHLDLRVRVWRRVDLDVKLCDGLTDQAKEAIAKDATDAADPFLADDARGFQAKRFMARMGSTFTEIVRHLAIARSSCEPSGEAFFDPGTDTEQLLNAVRSSTRAVVFARLAHQTAVRRRVERSHVVTKRGQA